MNKKITEEEITKQFGTPAGKTEETGKNKYYTQLLREVSKEKQDMKLIKSIYQQALIKYGQHKITKEEIQQFTILLQNNNLLMKIFNGKELKELYELGLIEKQNSMEKLQNLIKEQNGKKVHNVLINTEFDNALFEYELGEITEEELSEYFELLQHNSNYCTVDTIKKYLEVFNIPVSENRNIFVTRNILQRAKEIIELNFFSDIPKTKEERKEYVRKTLEEIKEQYYIIRPNPFYQSFFLVYEDINTTKKKQYQVYNNSYQVQKDLLNQYNKFHPCFKEFCSYDKFINSLYHYEEEETGNKDILINNSIIYNFSSRMFLEENNNIPCFIEKIDYCTLSDNEISILDKFFGIMYNKEEFKQYLYYILCCMDKKYAEQALFLVVDRSGTGKTARIAPFAELGLIDIADSNLLKKTELYNIISTNCFVINEFQDNKGGSGGSINNIVDSTPLKVTRKGEGAIKIKGKDKPLLTIMGESLPFIEEMSDGTNRRMLLVPRMSQKFKDLKDTTKGLKQFYDILYKKASGVIEYYNHKIEEYNIEKEYKDIRKQMTVTLTDLEKLTEDKASTLGKFFELEPQYKDDTEFTEAYILEKSESLDIMLKHIEDNHIHTKHILNPRQRRSNFYNTIKKQNGVKNIKEFGYKNKQHKINDTKKTYTYLYAISLTPAGLEIAREINRKAGKHKVLYMKRYNETKHTKENNYIIEHEQYSSEQTTLL